MSLSRRNIKASKLKKLLSIDWSNFDKSKTGLNESDQIKLSVKKGVKIMNKDNDLIKQSKFRKMIKLPKVCEITTHSRATIYRRMAEGKFPKQINLTKRSAVWIEEEVLEYVEEKVRLRDALIYKNYNK